MHESPADAPNWSGGWLDTHLKLDVDGPVRIFDLAVRLERGMARHPHHPEFEFDPVRRHGPGGPYKHGVSAANERFAMGGHVGTHVDGFGHVAKDELVLGGRRVVTGDDADAGLDAGSIEETGPLLGRGRLFDGEALFGHQLTARDSFGPNEFERWFADEPLDRGSIVLVRTGQMRWWGDPERYLGLSTGLPGVTLEGARWLTDHGVIAVGSDTMNFEHKPSSELINLPVHVHLLVEQGVPIMESMYLEALAAERRYSFTFIAVPLRIGGSSGSPVRPIAIVER